MRVYEDNIDPNGLHNYDRHVLSDNVTCDPAWQDIGAYDVHSRMHYESFGFPKQGVTSPTMLAIVDAGLPIAKADVADMAIDPTGQVYTWWKLPCARAAHRRAPLQERPGTSSATVHASTWT